MTPFARSVSRSSLRTGSASSLAGVRGLQIASRAARPARPARGAQALQASVTEDVTDGEGFRAATPGDQDTIAAMVKAENMNPLFLDPANFIIAQDDDNTVVGIGQILSLIHI